MIKSLSTNRNYLSSLTAPVSADVTMLAYACKAFDICRLRLAGL